MAQDPAKHAEPEVAGTAVRKLTTVESTETTVLPDDSELVSPVAAAMLLELYAAR